MTITDDSVYHDLEETLENLRNRLDVAQGDAAAKMCEAMEARAECDTLTDQVARVEQALVILSGDLSTAAVAAQQESLKTAQQEKLESARPVPESEGPQCMACRTRGSIVMMEHKGKGPVGITMPTCQKCGSIQL